MALSRIVCEIQRLIGRKSRNVYTATLFMAPDRGNFVGILGSCFILIQLAWLDYPVVRNYDKAVSTIPERVGQTDRRTDRTAISISCVSMLTRDKKFVHWKTLRNSPIFPYKIKLVLHVLNNYYSTYDRVRSVQISDLAFSVKCASRCWYIAGHRITWISSGTSQMRRSLGMEFLGAAAIYL